jgi:restriction endonuclease Mrr
MPVPDFKAIMHPLLAAACDGAEHTLADDVDALARHFALTPGDRAFAQSIESAVANMTQAGLLEATGNGGYRITGQGRATLEVMWG